MIEQALILAGGLGTRLGELTRSTPKPMISVNGVPFLERLILHLKKQNITKFVLCIGYLSSVIQDHFGDGARLGVQIEYSVEKELLGTGGAIKKAFPLLDEAFFVISGDNYLELNYRNMEQLFLKQQAVGVLACWDNRPPLFKSNVELDLKTSQVLNYDYRSDLHKNYVDSGVKIFSRKLGDYFGDQERFSLEIEALPKIVKDKKLFGFPISKPPLDVGTLEGLSEVRKVLV